jgi:porin
VPGRPEDSFGIGVARTQFSSSFLPFLRQQFNLGLQREDAIEIYYNTAIAPWMNVTTDLQIVNSGLNRAVSPTTGQLTGIDTVVVLGTRLRVRF